jgi:hypothetical protein
MLYPIELQARYHFRFSIGDWQLGRAKTDESRHGVSSSLSTGFCLMSLIVGWIDNTSVTW